MSTTTGRRRAGRTKAAKVESVTVKVENVEVKVEADANPERRKASKSARKGKAKKPKLEAETTQEAKHEESDGINARVKLEEKNDSKSTRRDRRKKLGREDEAKEDIEKLSTEKLKENPAYSPPEETSNADEKDEESDIELPMSDYALSLVVEAKARQERPDWQANGHCYWLQISPSNRATCKPCGGLIAKGEVRFGSAAMERFHGSFMWRHTACVTGRQLLNVANTYGTEEYACIPGWWTVLGESEREALTVEFDNAKVAHVEQEKLKLQKREAADAVRKLREERKKRRERFLDEPGDWFDWAGLLRAEELDQEPVVFWRALAEYLGLSSVGTKKILVERVQEHANSLEEKPEVRKAKVDDEQSKKISPSTEIEPAKTTRKTRKKSRSKSKGDEGQGQVAELEEWGVGFDAVPVKSEAGDSRAGEADKKPPRRRSDGEKRRASKRSSDKVEDDAVETKTRKKAKVEKDVARGSSRAQRAARRRSNDG